MDNNIESFQVCVRIRPLLEQEKSQIDIERQKKESYPEQIVASEKNTVFL